MDKNTTVSGPYHQSNGVAGILYGEFTDNINPKVRYAVSLTDCALTVQKISSSPGQDKMVFNLSDCIGCHASTAVDSADTGAYFTVYFYPYKRRWMSSVLARQRVEQCFRVALVQDARANLEEAERWARAVREASARNLPRRDGVLYDVCRPCGIMLLLNPSSGRGQAMSLFSTHIQRMLTEAAVPHTLLITDHQNHARELVRNADLSQWNALIILSGDGLLFEVVNGLMEREDWEEAIQIPLGILPGGSGNALAASIHHYTGAAAVWGEDLLVSCGFMLCKGLVSRLDLVSVHLASGNRVFSFLSVAWGFVADVDIESEKYRHVGAVRFMVGTLVRLASLRIYQGRLAFLPASDDKELSAPSPPSSPLLSSFTFCSPVSCHTAADQPLVRQNQNPLQNGSPVQNSSSNAVVPARADPNEPTKHGPVDSLLVPLSEPVPQNWTVVERQDFVLVLAMYQSHLAEDLLTAPEAKAEEGCIHLFYVLEGISRAALLRLFLAMEKGGHLAYECPHLQYRKVQAFRLEPRTPQGVITVDGEQVEYGPVQAQIHKGLARLVTG
ncbi:sphingosine kinase 1 [Chanos chanos]|uniref:sphingosine kinase n=1 Tax=Chanos chanos TaxID=29144 RepID=A0A6J2WNE8_CHACN|nr:sphingosine kinase 1-like [Chanos chanos]